MKHDVAALYVRDHSIYHTLPGVDTWPKARDARFYEGPYPVVAHPPCRAWGKYAYKAKPEPGERELAELAVQQVRQFGGVLEHPVGSRLWLEMELPRPGQLDKFGGLTLKINQSDYGHRALKPTYLYICGVGIGSIPPQKKGHNPPVTTVENMCKAERESTPPYLAEYLVKIARSVI